MLERNQRDPKRLFLFWMESNLDRIQEFFLKACVFERRWPR